MTHELKVPEVRDDDPEEVADKLSIAAAMWTRGDKQDALSWVRRAAESASDAEADMRALDLAKAASALAASLADPSASPAAKPNTSAPPAASPGAPAKPPSKLPPPKPSVKPPLAGRPQSKLPPLPPLRPLGSAPAPAKPSAMPSKPKSASEAPSQGVLEAAKVAPMVETKPDPLDETQTRDHELPDPRPAASDAPTKRVRDEDEEETSQIDLGPSRPQTDLDATATHDAVGDDYLRVVAQHRAPSTSALIAAAPRAEEPAHEPAAPAPAPLALAVGVRVRIHSTEAGAWIVPEGESEGGIAAIVVPLDADDDLRSVFPRKG